MATIAEQHWKQHRPEEYANITDVASFFAELEDEAAAQIDDLEESLRGPDPKDEPFSDRMARYMTARREAEAVVFRDLLLAMPNEQDRSGAIDEELRAALAEFRELGEQVGTHSSAEVQHSSSRPAAGTLWSAFEHHGVDCPGCGWTGEGGDTTQGDWSDFGRECHCPSCSQYLGYSSF